MLVAYGDRVIVKTVDQSAYTSPSGLSVVDNEAREVMGTVIAVGHVTDVAVDDVVVFPPSAGVALDHHDERYVVLHEHEIAAIWESNT